MRFPIGMLMLCGTVTTLFISAEDAPTTPNPSAESQTSIKDKIAFIGLSDGYWQLWLSSLSNEKPRQITTSPYDKRDPSWSAEGRSILYRTNEGRIEIMDLESGKVEVLTPMSGRFVAPKFSPSGKLLVFARYQDAPHDNTDIYVYALATKAVKQLTEKPILELSAAWSPDENWLVFVSGHGEAKNKRALSLMRADGSECRILTPEAADYRAPEWAPDGKSIAFSCNLSGDFEIWRMNADGAGRQRLTTSVGLDSDPTHSPDGSRIAYVTNRAGHPQLVSMRVDGADQQVHSPQGLSVREPAWYRGDLKRTPAPKDGGAENQEGVERPTDR